MSFGPRAAIVLLGTAAALSLPASAQETDTQARQQAAADSQCLQSLRQIVQRMNENDYGLAGYPGAVVDGYGTRYPYGTAGSPDSAPVNEPAANTPANPWADVRWEQRPQYEFATLYRAATVLAGNGNEEACMAVVGAFEQRYETYTAQLNELGVEPGEVAAWRQAEIASAEPVTDIGFPRRIEDVIGSEVRNAQDENLGDIEDVVLDSDSGNVRYVMVSTGGFFDIGDETVAVPWDRLRVTRTGTFLLPVQEAAFEQAPKAEMLVDDQRTGSISRDEIDSYWDEALADQSE